VQDMTCASSTPSRPKEPPTTAAWMAEAEADAEAWHGESALLRLGVVSAGDAEGVCRSARPPVDYRPHGTVLVGHDHDDLSRGTAASSC